MSMPRKKGRLPLFFEVRMLCFAALLAAMSAVLAYFAKLIFGYGFLRFTVENLPILFAGVCFGPLVGGAVGLCADLISCIAAGMAPNPLISLAALLVGAVAGLLSKYCFRGRRPWQLLAVSLLSHAVGSMLIKTVALHLYYGYETVLLLPRIPLYCGIAVLEGVLLSVLLRNRQILSLVGNKTCKKGDTYDLR